MINELDILEELRHDLLKFIVCIDPKYKVVPHTRFICSILNHLIFGDKSRVIISLPPRHGKSLICSTYLPAFLYGLNPELEIIATSYGHDLAHTFGAKVRQIINSEAYQRIFPHTKIEGTGIGGKEWKTEKGGIYKATGAMGSLTGFGANYIIIDDIFKNSEEASSPTIRKKLKEWYDTTCYTRLLPAGKIIFLMTRWHEDDLITYVLENDKAGEWEYYNLAALAELEEDLEIRVRDTDLVFRRELGTALWPEHYPVSYLKPIMERNLLQFNALYQGRPGKGAKSGAEFNTDKLSLIPKALIPSKPKADRRFISLDTASKNLESHSYTVLTEWSEHNGILFLTDLIRDKFTIPDLTLFVESYIRTKSPDQVLIEDASSGIGLIQYLGTKFKPDQIIAIKPGTEKKIAIGADILYSDMVFLRSEPEFSVIIDELKSYPNGQYTDCVSSVIQALWWWSQNRSFKPLKPQNSSYRITKTRRPRRDWG